MMRINRRSAMAWTGLAAGAPGLLTACSRGHGEANDEQAQQRTWRTTPLVLGDANAVLMELVRCATLAPSSHNTQCWKFRIGERSVTILPDTTRRCPAVDPDDHHLVVSLGCAAENMVQAARAHGLMAHVRFDATGDGSIVVSLDPTGKSASTLFDAIPHRQCTRTEFDGQPVSAVDLKLLETAGTGTGVRVVLLTERAAMERVLAYVVQANSAQMNDPAFVAELKSWIRFSDDEAVRSGDGLFSRTSGNPSVPRWIGSPMFKLFYREASENDKYARQIRSSAGLAIFVPETEAPSDKAHWAEAGRCYERFALQATALGVRHAHLNQPVEVASLRPQFAASLGLGKRRPDLVVRFGRGPLAPRSLRRPIGAVLL